MKIRAREMSREINASRQNNSATLNEVYQFRSVYLFRPRPQPGPHLHSMCTAQQFFSVVRGRTIGHSSIRTPTKLNRCYPLPAERRGM